MPTLTEADLPVVANEIVIKSPSHKLGQIVGEVLENACRPTLTRLAQRCGHYLDYNHPRAARGGRVKVTWEGSDGKSPSFDFVVERGGSEEEVGQLGAIIEVAYRGPAGHGKHSVNKINEITASVQPVLQAHHRANPIAAVVLAGRFTSPALSAMSRRGFSVYYVPQSKIDKVFSEVGIDVDFGDFETPAERADFCLQQISAWEGLGEKGQRRLTSRLAQVMRSDLNRLSRDMERHLTRRIESVTYAELRGARIEGLDRHGALASLRTISEVRRARRERSSERLSRWEVELHYSDGDVQREILSSRAALTDFLMGFEPIVGAVAAA